MTLNVKAKSKGAFNNYVDMIFPFFWPPTRLNVNIVYPKREHWKRIGIFWTTYPPNLVHVVIECPQKERENQTYKVSRVFLRVNFEFAKSIIIYVHAYNMFVSWARVSKSEQATEEYPLLKIGLWERN